MIESNNKLKWYVFRHDFNRKVIYPFNIFDHYSFYQDCCKHYKRYLKDKNIDNFFEEIRKDLQYYMWSKCEYEVIISELFSSNGNPTEEKVDAYSQVMMNWDAFKIYVLENIDKFKKG
mgnify:CR=1 FL=1